VKSASSGKGEEEGDDNGRSSAKTMHSKDSRKSPITGDFNDSE